MVISSLPSLTHSTFKLLSLLLHLYLFPYLVNLFLCLDLPSELLLTSVSVSVINAPFLYNSPSH